jgi:hypothetical protein
LLEHPVHSRTPVVLKHKPRNPSFGVADVPAASHERIMRVGWKLEFHVHLIGDVARLKTAREIGLTTAVVHDGGSLAGNDSSQGA